MVLKKYKYQLCREEDSPQALAVDSSVQARTKACEPKAASSFLKLSRNNKYTVEAKCSE